MKKQIVFVLLLAQVGCSNLVPERLPPLERGSFLHLYDSDADGVSNYWDQCPHTPSEAPVTERGCPGDSDGDGIPDYRDDCDQTPAGQRVLNDGCAAHEVVGLDPVYVEFEFNSGRITPTIASQLDQLALSLNSLPQVVLSETVLQVVGHTDSAGSATYNQWLSERRAQAVAQYLRERSSPAITIELRGEGEHRPLTGNTTATERARNRRVEVLQHSAVPLAYRNRS